MARRFEFYAGRTGPKDVLQAPDLREMHFQMRAHTPTLQQISPRAENEVTPEVKQIISRNYLRVQVGMIRQRRSNIVLSGADKCDLFGSTDTPTKYPA